MTRPRSVVGLAGVDAHGMQGWGGAYEQLFRTLSQAVVLDAPLSGDAATDAARILEALRRGHAFSVITAWAGPASITLTASDGASMVAMGDRLATQQNSVEIRAAATGSTAARLVLSHLGGEVASGIDELTFHTPPNDAGAYRVEAYLPGHPAAPWIVSNPVYVGPEVAPAAPARPAPITSTFALTGADPAAWSIEHGPSSSGDVINVKPDLGFAYHVGAAEPAREYVALAYRMRDTSLAFDRLQFVGQADRPTRIWVQLRFPGTGDQRWIRSIYLDATPRPVVIALEDLVPADPQGSLRPVVARIQAVLFVVDRTNSALGSSGRVTLREITLTASAGSGPDR
jgi:hypothetical protein